MNGPLDGTQQEHVGCQLEEDEFLIGCSCISSLGQLGSGPVMEDQDNPRRGKESLHWSPNCMSARRMKKILNLTQQLAATVEIPDFIEHKYILLMDHYLRHLPHTWYGYSIEKTPLFHFERPCFEEKEDSRQLREF